MKLDSLLLMFGFFLVFVMAAATRMTMFQHWQFWVIVGLITIGWLIARSRLRDLS